MGERSGAPSGFSPASIVISKPPVAVQLPQPDVSANRDAPQSWLFLNVIVLASARESRRVAVTTKTMSAIGFINRPARPAAASTSRRRCKLFDELRADFGCRGQAVR